MDERPKTTINGPIELRGYDTLNLINPHTAILPTGETFHLPAGTKLVTQGPAGGKDIEYTGSATKAPRSTAPLS